MDMELPPFQTLLDRYGHDVHRFLVANVGAIDADDCYQETWIAALRAYPRLEQADNLRGWLLTIASRKAIDLHRARGRGPVAMADPPEPADHGAPAFGAATGAGEELWGAVGELPPKQRAAVVLRYMLDAGYETVAAAMGISEAAARRNVHEGLKRLRQEHGHEWTA
jgi:RNA polymerase sigma factor (sigma-70 family)